MNTTRALFLTCAMAAASLSSMSQAAKTPATPPENKAPETKADILLLDKWRHVGFHLISDWQGGEVDSVLDDPTFGFALTYMKHDRHGLLDGGFDIGFQPMGGFRAMAPLLYACAGTVRRTSGRTRASTRTSGVGP